MRKDDNKKSRTRGTAKAAFKAPALGAMATGSLGGSTSATKAMKAKLSMSTPGSVAMPKASNQRPPSITAAMKPIDPQTRMRP